jgi:hypothetical protein
MKGAQGATVHASTPYGGFVMSPAVDSMASPRALLPPRRDFAKSPAATQPHGFANTPVAAVQSRGFAKTPVAASSPVASPRPLSLPRPVISTLLSANAKEFWACKSAFVIPLRPATTAKTVTDVALLPLVEPRADFYFDQLPLRRPRPTSRYCLLLSPERTSTSTSYHCEDRDRRRATALLLSPERTSTSTSYHCYDLDRRRAIALLLSPERTPTSTSYHCYDRDRRRATALLLSLERTSTSTSYHRKDRHRRRATASC